MCRNAFHATSAQHDDSQKQLAQSLLNELCFWDKASCNHVPSEGKQAPLPRKAMSDQSIQKNSQPKDCDGGHSSSKTKYTTRAQSQDNFCPESELKWQSATDLATGRVYYYNCVTMQSQWNKPREIRNWEKEKRKRDKVFFREMEQNILESFQRRELIPGISHASISDLPLLLNTFKPRLPSITGKPKCIETPVPPELNSNPMNRIRTISGMDESVLADLYSAALSMCTEENEKEQLEGEEGEDISGKNGEQPGKPPLHPQLRFNPSEVMQAPKLQDRNQAVSFIAEAGGDLNEKSHPRRHSENIILVDSTLINPDIAATIKSVCGVYRVYVVENTNTVQKMASAPQQMSGSFAAATITPGMIGLFRDDYEHLLRHGYDPACSSIRMPIPSIDEIIQFFTEFYEASKMQHDTILMTLIYLERLMKYTDGVLVPRPENWRSLLFSCMILASKVWDDFSMWNVDFSVVSFNTGLANFSLQRINRLELAILSSLMFDVQVTDSEYAKYYFLIRTMMIRSRSSGGNNKDEFSSRITNTKSSNSKKNNQRNSHLGTIESVEHPDNRILRRRGSAKPPRARRARSGDWFFSDIAPFSKYGNSKNACLVAPIG